MRKPILKLTRQRHFFGTIKSQMCQCQVHHFWLIVDMTSGRWAFFRLFQNLLLKSAMPRTNDKMGGFRSFGNVLIEASPPFPVSVINFYLSLGAPRHGQLCHNLLLASWMVKRVLFCVRDNRVLKFG